MAYFWTCLGNQQLNPTRRLFNAVQGWLIVIHHDEIKDAKQLGSG
jgi:hypothetical protein